MKNKAAICAVIAMMLLSTGNAWAFKPKDQETMPFFIYYDNNSQKNHFVPSGWMGDFSSIKINQSCKNSPYSGNSCIEITYTGQPSQGAGWVGVFWQNPENNWGSKDGGYNLSRAGKLTLMARGAKGGEILEFKTGGITGQFPDSDTVGIGPLALSNEWSEYTIDLSGAELFYISGGFVFAASRMDNPDGFVIYLDDIKYE
ncbi:MAG: hypothetical protein PHV77_02135 [Candidatus Omnitrophica bacterium]|nr:hypothetical protein [Candidatus Omnitrophota bacterium]